MVIVVKLLFVLMESVALPAVSDKLKNSVFMESLMRVAMCGPKIGNVE